MTVSWPINSSSILVRVVSNLQHYRFHLVCFFRFILFISFHSLDTSIRFIGPAGNHCEKFQHQHSTCTVMYDVSVLNQIRWGKLDFAWNNWILSRDFQTMNPHFRHLIDFDDLCSFVFNQGDSKQKNHCVCRLYSAIILNAHYHGFIR